MQIDFSGLLESDPATRLVELLHACGQACYAATERLELGDVDGASECLREARSIQHAFAHNAAKLSWVTDDLFAAAWLSLSPRQGIPS